MKSQSQHATKVLAGLLLTSALILSACGAVKSGFKSDPLSGNDRYQEMRKNGVPQTQVVPGEGKTPVAPAVSGEIQGAGSAPVAETPVATTGNAPKVPSVEAPAPAEAKTFKLKIAELALPETRVLNFVEGIAVRYELTIENSKGTATVDGLQDGLKLTPLSGDVYELAWTAPVNYVKSKDGLNSYPIRINTAANRQYSLAIAVSLTKDAPMIRKIDLNSAQITLGEADGFDVLVSAKNVQDAKTLKMVIENEDSASQGEQNVVEAAVFTDAVAQGENLYLLHAVLDMKKLAAADMKAPKFELLCIGTRLANNSSRPRFRKTITVNPKVVDTAKKDSTTATTAFGVTTKDD